MNRSYAKTIFHQPWDTTVRQVADRMANLASRGTSDWRILIGTLGAMISALDKVRLAAERRLTVP